MGRTMGACTDGGLTSEQRMRPPFLRGEQLERIGRPVDLFTRDGGFVQRVYTLPMLLDGTIIIWGERLFVYENGSEPARAVERLPLISPSTGSWPRVR